MPKSPTKSKAAASVSHVVDEARFKLLPVASKVSIKQFVEKNGITFAPGRGFYQLTKPETIQAYKEIVAVRKDDGLQVTGVEVRALLNIESDAKKFKYVQQPDFDVFVQSTSYNRVLMPDTQFLYEVSPAAGSPTSFRRGGSKEARTPFAAHSETRKGEAPVYSAGSPIDLVFSFDTTGSMYSCLDLVRKNLKSMITRILSDVPNIRIAVFAHGDYCDRRSSYVTKHIDFSVDKEKLVKFVTNVASTGGGDWEECYELVMQEARKNLNWRPGSQRAMIMIGDAIPHSVDDYKNAYKAEKLIDWRKEADELLSMGCRVYSVQYRASASPEADKFWGGLAYKTYGHHLELTNWDNVLHFIMAIAFCESGPEHLEAYKQEIIKSTPGGGGLNADLHALFNSLGGGKDDDGPAGGAGAAPSMSLADFAASKSTGVTKKPTVKGKPAGAAKGASRALATKKRKAESAEPTTPVKKSKITAKKPASKKAPVKKSPAKKAPVKKAPAKKSPVKKAPAKKAPAKKAPAKKAPAKKAPAKKDPAKKASAKKAPAKKTPAKTVPNKKVPAKRAPVKKASVKKTPAKKLASKATSTKGRGKK